MSRSPNSKRIKLDSSPKQLPEAESSSGAPAKTEEDPEEDHCIICLQSIVDRTVLPACCHDNLCFECITIWTEQSRKCPLCSAAIGPYLIHNIRSEFDFTKHYLFSLRSSPPPLQLPTRQQVRAATRQRREPAWGRPRRNGGQETDILERAVEKRRWVYRHNLYAKHIASNTFTRFRPYPTPTQFNASPDLIGRTTTFLRRELQVWVNLDIEFLVTFIIALLRSLDIRSEPAIKLLAEFLDLDTKYTPGCRMRNAEHFAHELCLFLRSPYRDLKAYDKIVQYDGSNVPPPHTRARSDRWRPERSPDHYSPEPLSESPRISQSQSYPEAHRSRSPATRSFAHRHASSQTPAQMHSPRGSTQRDDRPRSSSRTEISFEDRTGSVDTTMPNCAVDSVRQHPKGKGKEREGSLDKATSISHAITGVTLDHVSSDLPSSCNNSNPHSTQQGNPQSSLTDTPFRSPNEIRIRGISSGACAVPAGMGTQSAVQFRREFPKNALSTLHMHSSKIHEENDATENNTLKEVENLSLASSSSSTPTVKDAASLGRLRNHAPSIRFCAPELDQNSSLSCVTRSGGGSSGVLQGTRGRIVPQAQAMSPLGDSPIDGDRKAASTPAGEGAHVHDTSAADVRKQLLAKLQDEKLRHAGVFNEVLGVYSEDQAKGSGTSAVVRAEEGLLPGGDGTVANANLDPSLDQEKTKAQARIQARLKMKLAIEVEKHKVDLKIKGVSVPSHRSDSNNGIPALAATDLDMNDGLEGGAAEEGGSRMEKALRAKLLSRRRGTDSGSASSIPGPSSSAGN